MSDSESPWFTGSVTEAVNMATAMNVVFMVYIHDENEESQQMNNITESSNCAKTIKDKTVALRIPHDSEEAIMFGQLFTITKIPSIYLIRAGAVRDYIPGVVSEENLISRINTTASLDQSILPLSSSMSPPPLSSSSSSASTTTMTSSTTSSDLSSQPVVTQTSENSNDDLISRTERIKSKVEEKRKKREQEEIRTEKEREINRRNQGKDMQDIYRKQNEAKNKKIADDIAKQKKDDEEAKRRIREQIALDKAERQAKRQAELSLRQQLQQDKKEICDNINHTDIINGSYTHSNISVRLLNGDTVRKKFQSTQTLGDVKAWIEEDRTDGNAPYNLIQNFPHRQYGINDETRSLKELNLCPSGTLICKPSKNISIAYSNNGGFVWNFITSGLSVIGTMLSYINPLAYFYGNRQQRQSRNYNNVRHNNNSSRSNEHDKNNNKNSGKSSERNKFGNNVRTLSQNDDDLDKRWTYNGNSTNQE